MRSAAFSAVIGLKSRPRRSRRSTDIAPGRSSSPCTTRTVNSGDERPPRKGNRIGSRGGLDRLHDRKRGRPARGDDGRPGALDRARRPVASSAGAAAAVCRRIVGRGPGRSNSAIPGSRHGRSRRIPTGRRTHSTTTRGCSGGITRSSGFRRSRSRSRPPGTQATSGRASCCSTGSVTTRGANRRAIAPWYDDAVATRTDVIVWLYREHLAGVLSPV